MGEAIRKTERPFAYRDYRGWPDDERWELIDGVAYNMSPAANRYHQGLLTNLFRDIAVYLEGKPCKIYVAPFDVLLPDSPGQDEDDVQTVVQPDILVVCDPAKLTPKGCTGAPDWVIEILSPWTAKKDFHEKLSLYERHGVREYWIIDPAGRYLHVYALDAAGHYPAAPKVHLENDRVACGILAGLIVDLEKIFAE